MNDNDDPLPMNSARVGDSMARGAAWMMLFKFAERSVGLLSILILARLLTPADFGLVAMATAVVGLMELMGAFGFDIALIQRQDARRSHYDTAWTFNALFSMAVALLLLLLTIPAANFYHEPRLIWILPALAIGALIQGFENIGTVAFRKELDFQKEFRFLLAKKLASFVVTIVLAISFRSYWALVVGIVTGRVFSVWISYRLHPYRPRFSLSARQDLFHFSKWLFFSNLVLFFHNKSADFILGRTVGAHGLGIYNVALEIAVMPSTELIAPLNRAIFPAYSRLSADISALRSKFLEVFSIISLIAIPASVGLACIADPVVKVILGDQWVEAIPLLRLFAIAGLVSALQSNLYLVIVAIGKPKANTYVSAGLLLVSLPVFIFASLRYGTVGAAWSYTLFSVVGLLVIQLVFLRLSGVGVKAYFSSLWRPIFASVALAVAILLADGWFAEGKDLLKLLSLIVIGAVTYIVAIISAWWLSGKPTGGEKIVINFLFMKLGINKKQDSKFG